MAKQAPFIHSFIEEQNLENLRNNTIYNTIKFTTLV